LLELSERVEDFLKRMRHSAKTLSVLDRQKVIRLIIKEVLVGFDKITIKHSIPITGSGASASAGAGVGASGSKEKKSYQLCPRRIGTSLSACNPNPPTTTFPCPPAKLCQWPAVGISKIKKIRFFLRLSG